MAAGCDRGAVRAAGGVLDRRRQGGREPRLLLRPLRAAVRAPARRALDARALAQLSRRRRRYRGRARRRGLHRVRAQGALPQSQGRRGQPVRQLLPRQLAVLRPQRLRPFPRARDGRRDDGRALVAQARRRPGLRGPARLAAGGPRDELLAVEHRGAAARPRRARGLALGHAADRLLGERAGGARGRRRAGRARQTALRPEGIGRLDEQRHKRARQAHFGRLGTVRAAAGVGLRLGLV